jgi:hypothetical protein
MRRHLGTIEASDAEWIRRGDLLVIEGEAVRAVAVDGNAVTIGRWSWRHTLAVLLLRRAVEAGYAVQEVLCGLRGHRLTAESRDIHGENLTLYCWCAKRYEYVGEPESEDW